MRRFLVAAVISFLGLSVVTPVFALDSRTEKIGTRPGVLRKEVMQAKKGTRAAVGSGTLATKSGDSAPAALTVTGKDGKTYTVNVDANTQLRRKFWGKSTLAEMSVGDTLNVIGKWSDDTKTTVLAKLVRDVSVQKRHGVFLGMVQSLTADGWVMETKNRGTQTVTVLSSTKFVNRREQIISKADILAGHKVRVKGLWDSKLNTITEVAQVKDYSLPATSSAMTR